MYLHGLLLRCQHASTVAEARPCCAKRTVDKSRCTFITSSTSRRRVTRDMWRALHRRSSVPPTLARSIPGRFSWPSARAGGRSSTSPTAETTCYLPNIGLDSGVTRDVPYVIQRGFQSALRAKHFPGGCLAWRASRAEVAGGLQGLELAPPSPGLRLSSIRMRLRLHSNDPIPTSQHQTDKLTGIETETLRLTRLQWYKSAAILRKSIRVPLHLCMQDLRRKWFFGSARSPYGLTWHCS